MHELGLSGRITGRLFRQFVSAVAVPQVLFYLGLGLGSLAAAVGAGGGWTALLQAHALLRRRLVDPLSLSGLLVTACQAVAALAAHSPAVYTGTGVVENLLAGLGLFASSVIGRPLLPAVIDRMVRQQAHAVLTLPVRAALGRLTLVWAIGSLARAAGIYVALTHLPLAAFLVVNTLIGWPLTGLGALASAAYVRVDIRRSGRIRPEGDRVRSSLARCAA